MHRLALLPVTVRAALTLVVAVLTGAGILGIARAFEAINEDAKLPASDVAPGGLFGRAVSVDGDTAVIGAFRDDDEGPMSGSAYVFVRSGTGWVQQAKLTAGDAGPNEQFGRAVSLDGDTAVVGAPGDDAAGPGSGSAYVFVRSGSRWEQRAKLTTLDMAPRDHFGFSVSVSGDLASIGSPFDDDAGSTAGSAYVFARTGSSWEEQAKLTAGDAAADDEFGRSVSIDGDTVLIGAPFDDDAGFRSGSAYVFVRTATGWEQQAKLTASDGAAGHGLGHSVSIDGDKALIGAPDADDGDDEGSSFSGSAYLFVRSDTSWDERAKLTASDAAALDSAGFSVSMDGDTALVGAPFHGVGDFRIGAAYIFDVSGPTPTTSDAR